MENIIKEGMDTVIINHYNHSGKLDRPRNGGVCKMVFLLIICMLIILENIMVLLAIWRNKRFHSRMYLLIGNLALSDLLAGTPGNVGSIGRRVSSRPSDCSLVLLRTVVIVLGVFVVCWTPLFVLLLLDVGCSPQRCEVLYKVDWFIALAVLNSALNPLIYTLSSREMRGAFYNLLCCSQTTMEPCGSQSRQTGISCSPPLKDVSRLRTSDTDEKRQRGCNTSRAFPKCLNTLSRINQGGRRPRVTQSI
uniref:Sphingosine-1-phosphate receptor 3a n=1 Tax=Poecilia latipinna TaxID=48699 RepID=A0A3B3TTZ7_9TELE